MAKKKILIVAGEASSDLHAASLIREIKALNPEIDFLGLGGEKMQEAGAKIYYNLVDLAVVGFFEVLKNLRKFKTIFAALLEKVDETRPELAILVDYPGFNLRLAKELKKRQVPVIYYISPQVWAWGKNRIQTIKKLIKKMLVFFKFEEELYQKEGIPVSFVGHPLLDTVRPKLSRDEFLKQFSLIPAKYTLAILPGSRLREVKTHLPIMLEAARLIEKKLGDTRFLILRAASLPENVFARILARYKLPAYILTDMTYDGLSNSDFAIVASGTATLETAILGIPLAIVYKISLLTWLYIKSVIKIPYIGMVNIVANDKIAEEFIQYNAKPKKIADYAIDILTDERKQARIKQLLAQLKSRLGEPQAAKRAARLILESLDER